MGAVRSSWSAWGDASSAVRAVPIATGCSVKVGSSISVSWLQMPGHGGAGSRSRNGLFCVPWARCTSAVACHPSPFHGLARCGGWFMSPLFEMLSVLFPGNMGSHFLGISRSVFGNVWFLLFLELLASSCPDSYRREGGSAGLGLHPPAPMAPDPATRLSGLPH